MATRDSITDAETVIAASVKVEGEFVSQGNVLIEGVVEGSLRTEKNLHVGQQARIAADVVAANATVAGEVQGNLTVAEKLELEPTARIIGDVRSKTLVVAAGAQISGHVSMGAVGDIKQVIKAGAAARAESRQPAMVGASGQASEPGEELGG